MLKKIFLFLFIAATLACKADPRVSTDVDGSNNLKPDLQQSIIAKDLVDMFESYHYKKIELNDSIASVIFNKYIKSLDQGKNYLIESDIKEFEPYRSTLDDDLRNGDLSTMFKIFNVFQKRYTERVKYALSQVDKKFDFASGGTYTYDREKLPWLASATDANALWENRVKYELLNLKIAGSTEAKSIETLKKRYENLLSQTAKTNNQDAFQVMMDAFTESIDPHTNYFVPARAQEFKEEMARSFEGIGASLVLENEVVTIKTLIPGGPASKSKLININDRIIAVGQGKSGEFEDVTGWRLDNTVSKIKGIKGTTVRLKIIPAGQELTSTPKIIELVRDKIIREDESAKKTVKNITSNGKNYKIGIITLPGFYADFEAYQAGDPNYKSTTRDVRKLLDTLKQEKVDAVLLDLRGNGGGSLTEAIDLTGLFIKNGPVVQVRDSRNKIEVDQDEDPSIAWSGPFGVMIDRFSASASEIFAGAIQDYGRGIIIGTQTYGKGTVQSSIDMSRVVSAEDKLLLLARGNESPAGDKSTTFIPNANAPKNLPKFGQVNITIAKFYRVNGSSTQHKGVMPDIKFAMIYPPDKFGESSEPSALPWDTIKASKYVPFSNLSAVKPQLVSLHDKRMQASSEYKYLLEDIAQYQKRTSETTITLNETQLKKERDLVEATNLARENQRRALKGLPSIKKGDPKPKEDELDFVRDESMQVMADFIKLESSDQLTKK